MNVTDVRTVEQAREFLQKQETNHAQLINNQRVIPNDVRKYMTTQALSLHVDGNVFFLAIGSIETTGVTLQARWIETEKTNTAATGRR